jgi:hypothetical protein
MAATAAICPLVKVCPPAICSVVHSGEKFRVGLDGGPRGAPPPWASLWSEHRMGVRGLRPRSHCPDTPRRLLYATRCHGQRGFCRGVYVGQPPRSGGGSNAQSMASRREAAAVAVSLLWPAATCWRRLRFRYFGQPPLVGGGCGFVTSASRHLLAAVAVSLLWPAATCWRRLEI